MLLRDTAVMSLVTYDVERPRQFWKKPKEEVNKFARPT